MNNYPNLTLIAHKSESYVPRTWHNAASGDVTLALAVDLTTAGEKLTHKAAGEKYIGFQLNDETKTLDLARLLYKKMKSTNAKTLNVAGNGIYTLAEYGCSQDFINLFVYEIISKVHEHYKIEKIFTGGQTGVDMAGAISGIKLGIPVDITFPSGFKQRFEDKKDITQTKEDIISQIDFRLEKLNEALNPPHKVIKKIGI